MLTNGDKVVTPVEEMESAINAPGPGFLGLLQAAPSNIRQYAYQSIAQFLDIANDEINNVDGLFLLTGVSDEIFESTFRTPEDDHGPFSSWSSYDAELGLVLFKMSESPRHSFAGEGFDRLLVEALQSIEMARQILPVGTILCMSLTGGKKADKTWRPRGPWCRDRTEWPNLVLEVAVPETRKP